MNTTTYPDLTDPQSIASEHSSLVHLLRWRACNQPDQLLYTFLPGEDGEESRLTFKELDQRARSIGAQLQSLGVSGQRVLLLYPPGLEYVAAFFGCLYAGAIAVPLYPPRPNRTLHRIQTISSDAEATIALTTTAVKLRSELLFETVPELKGLRWITTDNIPESLSAEWVEADISRHSLAYLQYTSGSTGAPRGVMVTHENLLRNLADIDNGFRHTSRSVIVSWLPHFHDMGLIYGIIQPLYQGIQGILMSPVTFLQRPSQWLETLSRYRATHSGGPNFAYDLCVRKVTEEERASLDLGNWKVAFNGAEPIHRETLERFAEAFAPCGFQWKAFSPSYGLAEATLKVSATRIEDAPTFHFVESAELERNKVVQTDEHGPQAVAIVSCGRPVPGTEVVIAHPESLERCAPDEVGEIWVSGASVSQGYWNRQAETAQGFHAYLRSTGSGPFLRTGDLGFIKDGEVFVTGRLKELIIIRGRNHYPQDIELTVQQSHPLLRVGCGAAFSVTVGNEERLVVVQEIQRNYSDANGDELVRSIRQAVANHHELQVYAVTLIKTGTLSKTSSGKIQRQLCRKEFLTGDLDVVTSSILDERYLSSEEERLTRAAVLALEPEERRPALETYLRAQVARAVNVAPLRVPTQSSLSSMGLDSLATMELKNQIEIDLGVVVPPTFLLEGRSLEGLAADLLELLTTEAAEPSMALDLNRETTGEHPLSYGQHALWYIHQLDRQSAAYNLTYAVRVNSAIDVTRLRRASQLLIDRHPVLRTTFTAQNGKAVQIVHSHREVHFEETDASNWSERELNEHLAEIGDRPFDLEHGPAFRVYAFKCPTREDLLLLSAHHIVCDLWSLNLLMTELRALYLAEREGVEVSLRMPELQYTDYVHWQAKMVAGAEGERLWEFWQNQLAGRLPVLNLPSDRPRPPIQTFRGRSHIFSLSDQLTRRLKTLAQSEGVTLYTTLLAAFQVLLHRYTSEEDIITGTVTSGRNRPQLADVAGYFVNPVAMRTDLSGNPSFKTLLGRVRRGVMDAMAHQDYPFPLVVERLQASRDPSRSPIFQVVFVWDKPQQSGAVAESASQSFELKTAFWKQGGAAFDLMASVLEEPESLSVSLNYNTDLFDANTVVRMAGHFQTILESIADYPEQQLSEVSMLTASERRQLLEQWNETEAEYPASSCVHHLFEAQVELTPESIVCVSDDGQLTYEELNSRANQLAHYLRTAGVGPETRVAICMERTPEMLVGLLGILKAGGAYVALDPAFPQMRLAYMLEDSAAPVLLTQESLYSQVSTPPHTRVICLDTEWQTIASHTDENPVVAVAADNCAYVIYTSGSTGNPKGVQVTHRSVVNFLTAMRQRPGLSSDDRLLAITTLAFDIAGLEIFLPMTVGARLLLVSSAMAAEGMQLAERVAEASTLQATPAMWRMLLAAGWQGGSNLKALCGGEALRSELAEQLLTTGVELWNMYGPTETTIWSSVARIDTLTGGISIGRPINNTQFYILDRNLNPVPVGVPGELYIGGDGLARGYLNHAEFTAEKFMPNPWSTSEGARLYRTGDLARYRSDGEVEFLGRLDYQVKIRGHRVELGEIETHLKKHPAVSDAIVVSKTDTSGEEHLVAYIVLRGNEVIKTSELREYVREKLPNYMVPSVFVFLDEMPLTPNGKVNRRALPEPVQQSSEADSERIAARSSIEEILAGIWSEVLGVRQPGIHDDFFALGGHSLLGTQIVSRVRTAFGVELSLRTLFETPTISSLARQVAAARQGVEGQTSLPLGRIERTEVSPLSPAQQRLWFLDELAPDSALYNIPAVIRLRGSLDVAALEVSFKEVARRHEILRTRFAGMDDRPVQVVEAVEFKLDVIDLRDVSPHQEAEAQRLSIEEARRPFNLNTVPLWRVSLLRLADEEYVLLLTMHHVISDGWSIEVLMREIATFYAAHVTAKDPTLPGLPIQYADFVYWQREWLQKDVLEAQRAYWKQQLTGAPPVLELPADYPRPAVQSYRGATESFVLPEDLSNSLKELSQREGVTLFMTLLAAFQTLLFRYTRQEDIVVGTPVAGRNHAELENLIGFFVNTLALRTSISGDPTFQELTARVREVVLDAYANQDVPFEKVVEELQPARDLGHSPLFQVMLALQSRQLEASLLPGLQLTATPGDTGTSKFDLTLFVTESEDGLLLSLEYSTDLFKAETIDRLLGHFVTLLRAVAANPARRISEFDILTPYEHRQLSEWNETAVEYPRSETLHGLFEAQVNRSPTVPAVIYEGESLTYAELNERSNRLAYHLQSFGVGPEVTVGVFMERSIELVVSLFAILKAGAAYLPLDPEYPQERLSWMVEDARIPVMLTQQRLISRLETHRVHVVTVDAEWDTIASDNGDNLAVQVSSGNAAYVIYTSGSTGRPKGVVNTHGGICNRLLWMQDAYGLTEADRVLQKTPFSFDVSVWEFFWPLLVGARLVVARPGGHRDSSYLADLIAAEQVTTLHFVPSMLQSFLGEPSLEEKCPSFTRVICSGEALGAAVVQHFKERLRVPLFNLYGPTEAAVDVTHWECATEDATTGVPIGHPIANTQIYILDTGMLQVPVGVPGELYIGGVGVARGYLNRPDLTAERFVPDPYGAPGGRLYRTGDLARYRADGAVEFIGRVDHQVKIRGFRIELGEIESVLEKHQAVRQAVVVLHEGSHDDKRLVAFVSTRPDLTIAIDELRDFLRKNLPEYMVPSAIVMVEALPLLPNGKVDRHALVALSLKQKIERAVFVAPRTPIEEVLTKIWGDVLGIEAPGIHDNFFDLGGHSLMAAQVRSRLREGFEMDLPLRLFFESPSVAQLATAIERLGAAEKKNVGRIAQLWLEVDGLSAEEIEETLERER